jgi:hypothetical protein
MDRELSAGSSASGSDWAASMRAVQKTENEEGGNVQRCVRRACRRCKKRKAPRAFMSASARAHSRPAKMP